MNDLDLISEAKIEVTSTGVNETLAKVDQLAGSVEGLAVAQDGLSKAQIRVNAQLESTAKRYDAEYKALSELSKAVNLLERARSQGLSGTEAYARIQDNVTLKLQAQANAAKIANEAQQALASTIRQQAQSSINASTGVRMDFDTESRAADIAAFGAELDRLREKFVPVFALSQQLARAQAEVAEALNVGAISANEAAEANLRLTRTYEDQAQKLERLDATRKASAQRQVNSQLIVPDRGADIAAYGAALNALQAEFDPLFAAEQKYIAYIERLDNALSVGAISQGVYNKRAAEAGAALDKAAAAAAGLVVEQEKVVTTTNSAAAAQEHFNSLLGVRTDFGSAGRAADIEAYGNVLRDTRAAYDPVYRAQEQYRDGLQKLRADFAAGAIPLQVFNAQLQQQKAAFVETAATLGMMSAQQREYAASAEAAARVSQVETAKSGMSADLDAYVASLKAERAELVPLVAVEEQYVAAEQKAAAALARGTISQTEYTAAVARARATQLNQTNELMKAEQANERLTKGVGLNAYAWQNLSFQVNDVITSLASGISPFQTLAQQGGQIYQILQQGQGGVGGALKGIADRLLSISPMVGVFGVMAGGAALAAAAVYSVAKASRDVELALLGVGKGAGLSADQIGDIAIKAARTADITVGAARDIETAFLRSGKVYGEVFEQATVAASNFGKARGLDAGKAGDFVAQNLSSLADGGYDALAKEAGNFDAKLEDQVRTLLNAGREMEAQRVVMERFGEAFDKVGDKLTTFDRALNAVKSGASTVFNSIGRGLSGAVEIPEQLSRVEAAIKTRRAVADSSGTDVDTSDLEAKVAKLRAALKATGDEAQVQAQRVRQNSDAAAKGAVSAIVPELASLEKVRQQGAEANKALNALEASGGSAERIDAAKKAVAAAAAAERDYAAAGGPANLERAKATELLKAGFAARAAVTPVEKAEAARQQALAETYGTLTSASERNARAEDARKKVLQDASIESRNQSRSMNESTKTANDLADATAKTTKSTELLSAQRKVDEQIASGQIDASQRTVKVQEQLRAQLSAVNKEASDRVRAAKDQTAVQQAQNDKVAAGAQVSAEAQRRQQGELQIAELRRQALAAEGQDRENLTARIQEQSAALEAQISAEKRAQVLSMSEESSRQIELLQKEGELLGLNNRERAVELAALQAKQSLQRQGISVTAPESVDYINKERLKADLQYAKDQYQRLSQDITSALGSIFDDMTGSGKKNLTTFFDSFSKGFSRIGSRLLQENLIGPLINGGLDGKGGSSVGGFMDKLSGFFGGGNAEKAVAGGAEKGIFSGITSLFSGGSKDSGAGGAFSKSNLGSLLAPAAIGGSIGYQSQSPMVGALGGAVTGFATGGIVGGLVGGAAGILGGLFGESQAKKQAKKQLQQELQARREAYEQAKPQIEALDRTFLGESIGAVGAKILDAQTQLKQAAKTASDAGDTAMANKLVNDFLAYMARMRNVFADSFEGTLRDIEKGFGPSGPFASAVNTVQTLGEALKAFVVDAGNLPDPAAGQRARAAAVQNALGSLDAPKTLSETQQEIERIQGTAAGLNQVLKDLGLSAEQAATAISDGTTRALAALADKFNTDLDHKINDAKGKGYLNDAADLIKEVAGLNADAASLGQDGGKVTAYFTAAAQKIVDGSQLVGDSFNQLIAAFPQLAGLVHEFSAHSQKSVEELAESAKQARWAIEDRMIQYQDRAFMTRNKGVTLAEQLERFDQTAWEQQRDEWKQGGQAITDLLIAQEAERAQLIAQYQAAIQERKKGFADREYAAGLDTSTLAGQLAAFDRQALREREAEYKVGGEAINELIAAQAAERLKIIKDFEKQAQTAFDNFANTIKKFLDSLVAGSNSPLSPQDRLAEAQKQYNEQLALARGGDQNAMGSITTYAQQLLDASKAFYASSQGFQDAFKQVQDTLSALPGQIGTAGFMKQYASGGWVQGPGSGTSDSIVARLSAGEYVMKATAANRYGPLLEAMNDDRPMAAAPAPRAPVSGGGQGNAAIAAAIRGLEVKIEQLRGDVQQGNDISEAGLLASVQATNGVGANIAKGNRRASRREVAA